MRFPKLSAIVVLSTALVGGLFSVAEATTFTVTTTNDSDDGACDAECSLREAIGAANSQPGRDEIRFDAVVFGKDRTIALSGKELEIKSNLSINGPDDFCLTVDARHQSRVFNVSHGASSIDDLVIANGTSLPTETNTDAGGGCILNRQAKLFLNRCVVMGGVSDSGGGILSYLGTLKMTNCTVVRNRAQQGGGLNNNDKGRAMLLNCTITDNVATTPTKEYAYGGGIANYTFGKYVLALQNCIVAGNHAPTLMDNSGSPDIDSFVDVDSYGYNLIGNSQGTNGLNIMDLENVDPGFELELFGKHPALKDNGGGTLTIALRPGSAALNAGAGYGVLPTDQRGAARPIGGTPDIGAFEQNFPPVIQSISLTPNSVYAEGFLTAVVNVTDLDGARSTTKTRFRWQRSREGKTTTLPETGPILSLQGGVGVGDDVITVTAIANDGAQDSIPASAHVTVLRSQPYILSLTMKPEDPGTDDKLSVKVQVHNPDGRPLLYSYTWRKNARVVQTTSRTTDSQNTLDLSLPRAGDKGDVMEVEVQVTDNYASATATQSVTVNNSVPSVSQLTLTPSSPTAKQTITAAFQGQDADEEDRLSPTYRWSIGTKVLPREKGATLDLSKYAYVKTGDVVTVEARVSDGTALSKTSKASVKVVAPDAVVVESVKLF